MWVGYFDEAGNDEKSKAFCIGGFIAENTHWLEIVKAWVKTLGQAGATCFHMTDFEARQGEFRGWETARRVKLIDELISIVLAYDVYGIGVGTVKDAYSQIIAQSHFISKRNFTPEWWKHPYLFVFQHCITEAANAADTLPPGTRVAFIFDRQPQFQARAEAVYAQLQEQSKWPRSSRLGSLDFDSKDNAVALQVADLAVFEVRKGIDFKLLEPEREIRKSMDRLRTRFFNPRYFDEAALRAFVATFDQAGTE